MHNWIEEAEKRQELKKEVLTEEEKRLQAYRRENKERLQPFLMELKQLVDRVNLLSLEEREPCLELGLTHLEGDEKYEFYGSSHKKETSLIIENKKPVLVWRRVRFRMTQKPGLVKVDVYEKFGNYDPQKHKYIFKIDGLKVEMAISFLNWLVFRTETEQFEEGLPKIHSDRSGKSDKRCFIATAAYGSYDAYEVELLRHFRDEKLLTNFMGRLFVQFYYLFSPPLARLMDKNDVVKGIVRKYIVYPIFRRVNQKTNL
jgi:hypothetical protein